MAEEDPFDNGASKLLVAAVHGVFVCSADTCVELFTSGSKGIVAARRTRSDGDVLAVADSHIVLLHHIEPGTQRTYRLNSTGIPRQLWYDNKSDCLIYTTALEPAVQVYSLSTQTFLEPATSHPSPPTLFTVHTSKDIDILLSASARPPTIFITSIETGGDRAKCLVQPPCTESACSAAAFHPSPGPGPGRLLFVLGFVDGTIAAYSYHVSYLQPCEDCQWEELASLRRAHVCVTESSPSRHSRLRAAAAAASAPGTPLSPDWSSVASEPVKVGDIATAVTAVALVPGYLCLSASVGSDGRCCITDFEPEAGPTILRSWNTHGSATALAVNKDRVAIGLKIGRMLVYNLTGDVLFCQEFGGHKIVDLEWISHGPSHVRQGEALQSKTNRGSSEGPKQMASRTTMHSVEKSPSFISLPAHPNSSRRHQIRRSIESTSGTRPVKSSIPAAPTPKLRQVPTLTSAETLHRTGPQTASRIPAKAASKASIRSPLNIDRQASSTSSTGTTRRISLGDRREKTSSERRRSHKPLQITAPTKSSNKASHIQAPPVPPRPKKSPGKQSKLAPVMGPLPVATSNASAQVSSGATKEETFPVSPLAFDGIKDKRQKRATFVEPPRQQPLPVHKRRSSSSSVYSDDYVLEWSHDFAVDTDANSKKRPDQLRGDARYDPFKQPPDLLNTIEHDKPLKRATNPRQPVLKAPFPGQRSGTFRPSIGSPVTPKASVNDAKTLAAAGSAVRHHSEAKRLQKSTSSRARDVGSPTPTRQRKEHSVELDLLSSPAMYKEKPRQSVDASSKGASSYVTAQTQTPGSPWASPSSSAPSWKIVDPDAVIREVCLEFRAEMNQLLERHERAIQQAFSRRLM